MNKNPIISMMIDRESLEKIDQAARKEYRSRSSFFKTAALERAKKVK